MYIQYARKQNYNLNSLHFHCYQCWMYALEDYKDLYSNLLPLATVRVLSPARVPRALPTFMLSEV